MITALTRTVSNNSTTQRDVTANRVTRTKRRCLASAYDGGPSECGGFLGAGDAGSRGDRVGGFSPTE